VRFCVRRAHPENAGEPSAVPEEDSNARYPRSTRRTPMIGYVTLGTNDDGNKLNAFTMG
jgi:hypothetical protein